MSMKRIIIGTCAVLVVVALAVYVKYNLSEWAMYYTKQNEFRKALWLWKLDALTGDIYTYPDHREQQIGELYQKLWDWDGARKYYERMVEGKDPVRDSARYLNAYRNLALACLRSGEEERGREILTELLSAGPDSRIPEQILSDLVTWQLAYPEMAPLVERYVMEREARNERVSAVTLGLFYLQIQQPAMALKVLQREESEKPEYLRIRDICMAIALEKLGRQDEVNRLCAEFAVAVEKKEISLLILSHFCEKNKALLPQGLQWARQGIAELESVQKLTSSQQDNLSGFYVTYAGLLFYDGRVSEAIEFMDRGLKLMDNTFIRRYYEKRLAEFRKALNPV